MAGQMYFGTRGSMQWVPCPRVSMPMGKARWSTSGTFLNGGAYVRSSVGGHKHYEMDWSMIDSHSARILNDYADNFYGSDELVYFLEPFAAVTNVLPTLWSNPSQSLESGVHLTPGGDVPQNEGTSRRNISTNPSFASLDGLVKSPYITLSNTYDDFYAGGSAVLATIGASPTTTAFVGQYADISAGEYLAATLRVKWLSGSQFYRFQLRAYNGATLLATVTSSASILGQAGQFIEWSGSAQMPAGTTRVMLAVYVYATAAGAAPVTGSTYVLDGWIGGKGATQGEALTQLGLSDSLAPWTAGRFTNQGRALFLGDSITEGTGTSDVSKRWQTLIQQRFSPTGAQFPFLPAWSQSAATGWPVVRSGGVRRTSDESTRWGFGWRTAEIYDATGSTTFTFTGTSCKVQFSSTPTSGVMGVQIDGGAVTAVNTNAGVTNLGNTWNSPALTDGVHTVVITRHATSIAGQSVWLQGLLTFRGDESRGVRILDGAKGSTSSAFFATDDPLRMGAVFGSGTTPGALQGAGTSSLMVYAYGTNDYGQGVGASQFGINTRAIINSARTYTPAPFTGSILLVGMYLAGGRNAAVWQEYHDQLRTIADEDPLIEYLDLREFMPAIGTPEAAGLYADSLHPSDLGHARIAQVIGDYLDTPTESFYFDGSTVSYDPTINYYWGGDANNSTSSRRERSSDTGRYDAGTYTDASLPKTLWLPVPDGYTFHMGVQSADPGAGVNVYTDNGVASQISAQEDRAFTAVSNVGGGVTIQIASGAIIEFMFAQILPDGRVPDLSRVNSGQGHSGCAFLPDDYSYEGFSAPEALDFVSVQAAFAEVGSWR